MALHDYYDGWHMLDRTTVSDDMGGTVSVYRPGAAIRAGCSTVSSAEVQVAYRQGLSTIYTIVTDTTVHLTQGDVIRRDRDGLTLRVTSDAADMTTPAVARVQYSQVTAERFTLKKGERLA